VERLGSVLSVWDVFQSVLEHLLKFLSKGSDHWIRSMCGLGGRRAYVPGVTVFGLVCFGCGMSREQGPTVTRSQTHHCVWVTWPITASTQDGDCDRRASVHRLYTTVMYTHTKTRPPLPTHGTLTWNPQCIDRNNWPCTSTPRVVYPPTLLTASFPKITKHERTSPGFAFR